ncbi:shikimate kinase [Candidatus Omnitrophota bacterium]
MMNDRNIVLVGFMGSGKSAVSRQLAELMKREMVSTDALIEKKEGRAITEIFSQSGEAYFRQVEKDVISETVELKGSILDCGGGVILDPDNLVNLKKSGITIYLRTSPDVIYARVKSSTHRPLLAVADPKTKIKEILDARKDLYEQADIIVDTDGKDVKQVCNNIIININNYK